MLSWTLRLAALAILTGFVVALPAQAQNLDAGKTPAQLFSGSCNECHKSARGLLRSVAPGSLPSFLRQHYTTSTDMAKTLSGFLLANGATETPRVANVPTNRQGRPDALPGNPQPQGATAANPAQVPGPDGTKQGRRPRPDAPQQQAARPDADGLGTAEPQRPPRNAKQGARAPEPGSDIPSPTAQPGSSQSKAGVRNTKRGAEPSDTPGAIAARDLIPQVQQAPAGEAAISAAVPLPDPADLPPPTIADFKADPPKSEPPKSAAKADPPKQQQAAAPAAMAPVPPSAPSSASARTSSASLTPRPAAGPPPTPPISH